MTHCKNTTIIRELSNFFQGETTKAMNAIMQVMCSIKFSDKGFDIQTACNATISTTNKILL